MDDNIFYNSRNMLIIPMVNKAFTMVDYAFLWWFFYRFTIVNNDRYFMASSDRLEMLKYIIFFSDRWQFHSTNGHYFLSDNALFIPWKDSYQIVKEVTPQSQNLRMIQWKFTEWQWMYGIRYEMEPWGRTTVHSSSEALKYAW